jgi:phage shock protein C
VWMKQQLFRNKSNKIIGGVATGLADYFDTDPVLIRVAFVVLAFMHGIGLLAYIILWIVMPVKPGEPVVSDPNAPFPQAAPLQQPERTTTGRFATGGIVLIVLGLMFLADNFIPHFDIDDYWPVVLIAIGAGILWNVFSKRQTNEVIQ